MKNEKLLQALGTVKEEFIEEAAPQTMRTRADKASHGWVKWSALAACAVLVVGISVPKIFRTINDDERSFWPEEEEKYDMLTDTNTAVTTTDTAIDTAVDFTSGADAGFLMITGIIILLFLTSTPGRILPSM